MKFLAGLLKFLSILVLLVGTIICTAVIVMAGIVNGATEAIWIMSGVWLCVVFVGINILATGIALSQVIKLKAKIQQLEQRPLTVQPEPASECNAQEPIPVSSGYSELPTTQTKKSKAWIFIVIICVLAVALVLAIIFPRQNESQPNEDLSPETFETEAATVAPMTECPIIVNGFCVDDSYTDEDGSSLKMVYLFYTMTAQDSNLKIDSKYTQLYIDGNQYESDHFADAAAACRYTDNYYYGSYIEDVYVGESKNVVATFYIPEGDLEPGKTVTLADSQIPGVESLSFSTDEFLHFSDPTEIAMVMDPEGFETAMYAREDADDATTQQVRSMLNNHYWTFYVNNTSYKLEFWATDNFSVTTAFGTQEGTYSVKNGYVFCTYPDTGYTVEIPYEIVDGEMDLDTLGGFDVFSN